MILVLIFRFNSKYMITRNEGEFTIWDFAAICNPQVKELEKLKIGMLKGCYIYCGEPEFVFDDLQIVTFAGMNVRHDELMVFDFLADESSPDVYPNIPWSTQVWRM